MSWQTGEAYGLNDLGYTAANGHTGAEGYSDKTESAYTAWGADKVWLPSVGDVADTWGTTINQRKASSAYWLRTAYAENLNEGFDYNEGFAYGLRIGTNGGTNATDYPVYNSTGYRPCINLNISKTIFFVEETTGYSRTNTDTEFGAGSYNAFISAWKTAINKSKAIAADSSSVASNYSESFKNSGNKEIARVFYDASKSAITFKMFADWGAVKSTYDRYACFNGGDSANGTTDATTIENDYFQRGALYIGDTVNLIIDLNGHTINRNLYDERYLGKYCIKDSDNDALDIGELEYPPVSYWNDLKQAGKDIIEFGEVIRIGRDWGSSQYNTGHNYGTVRARGGYLTLDDSSIIEGYEEFAVTDENGIKGCGRVTGGKHCLYDPGALQRAYGAGVIVISTYIKDDDETYGHFDLKNGAICYNDARSSGAAVFCPGDYSGNDNPGKNDAFDMYGGMLCHNYGGAFYAIWHTGAEKFLGGCISYNVGDTTVGYEGGSSTPQFGDITISHNKTNGPSILILVNTGVTSATFNGGRYNDNYSLYYGGIGFSHGGTWNSSSNNDIVTINSGEFKNNKSINGGLIRMAIQNEDWTGEFQFPDFTEMIPENVKAVMKVYINGGTFTGNTATEYGGIIYITKGECHINGGYFADNTAINGGAICMQSGTCNISGNPVFEHNVAKAHGGGIYLGGGDFTMNGGKFENNTCGGNGGGIYITGENSTFTMTAGSFKDNSAKRVTGATAENIYRYVYQRERRTDTFTKATSTTTAGTPVYETIISYVPMQNKTIIVSDNSTTRTTRYIIYREQSKQLITSGYGGGIYLENGQFIMSNGTFDKNYAESVGGAVYMTDGIFIIDTYQATHDIDLTDGVYTLNSISYISSDDGDVTGSHDVDDYVHLGKISFTDNIAPSYPGFYCPTVYFAGDLEIKGNETLRHEKRNVHLVNKVDENDKDVITERAVVYVSAPLDKYGYIGISKELNATGETWVAVGYNYEMTVDDLLCIHCDAGEDYLFSVKKGDDDVSGVTDVSYMYLSRKPAHVHSWQQTGRDASCTVQGYTVWVCTGCQEILDPNDSNHTGEGKYSPETSGFTDAGLGGPTEVGTVCTYDAPLGHNFVWDNAGYFKCSRADCKEKLYFDFEEIASLPYNTRQQMVSLSNIEWRLYSKDSDGGETTQQYVYIDSGSNINASTVYFGNVTNASSAVTGYVKLTEITQAVSGTHTIPYGSREGQLATGNTYTYNNKVTSNPTTGNRVGPTIEYAITKSTPVMDMTLPESTRDAWYVSDSENFFGGIEYNVSVTGADGTTITLDENGMEGARGVLTWTPSTLTVGTEVLYTWKWTPIATETNNIEEINGKKYVTAKDKGLWALNATRTDTSTIVTDEATMTDIGNLYRIVATYTKDEHGEDTETEVIASTNGNLRIALLTARTNGTAYASVRAGMYYVRFTYTYGTESAEYITEEMLTIRSKPMKHIAATMATEYTIYDNKKDLDEALTKSDGTSYITVVGWETDDTSGAGTPITAFTLSCANWGSGAGTYTVTVNYGTCEPVTVPVVVTANEIKKLEVVNWNQKSTPIVTKVAGDKVVNITNYADFQVQATYLDGSTKIVPKSVDNQLGYTLRWTNNTLNLGQRNSVTISYVEPCENTPSVTSRKECTAEFKVDPVTIVSSQQIDYVVKVGQTIDYANTTMGNKETNLVPKIDVTVKFEGEATPEIIPYGGSWTSEQQENNLYYTLTGVEYYKDSSVEEFYFTIRVNYGTGSSAFLKRRDITVDASKDEVEDITVGKTPTVPAIVTNLITLEFYVEHYVTVTENRTKSNLVVYDPYNDVMTGAGRVSATLQDNASGIFVGGQNNIIKITYTTEDGTTYVKNLEQYITEIVIESISVSVKDGYKETYSDAFTTKDGIASGNVFTSSAVNSASAISSFVTVTGTDTVGDTQEITSYTVTGSNVAGWQLFTITFPQRSGAVTTTVYVNVTAVVLESISATFEQGETVIYAATDVSGLINETQVIGHNNDGSEVAINSGFSLSIVDENGTALAAFDATKHNYIKVAYAGKECVAENEVEVSNKWFTGVKVTSLQTTNTIYVTASAEVIAENIKVEELYSDGSVGAVIAYNVAGGYTLEGSFEDGGSVTVEYSKDGVDVSEEVTCLNLTELEILSIEIDATEVPEAFYLVFGIDTLKNYLKVTATYNDSTEEDPHTGLIGAEEYGLSSTVTWSESAWSSTEQEACAKTYPITVTTTGNGTQATYNQIVKLGRISSIALVKRSEKPGPIQASASVDDYREYVAVTVNKTDGTQDSVQAGINNNEFHLEGESTVDGYYKFIVVINGVTFETNQEYASYDLSPVLGTLVTRQVAEGGFSVTGGQGADDLVISGATKSSLASLYTVTVEYNDGGTKTLTYADVADNDHYTIEGTLNAFDNVEEQAITIKYTYVNTNTNEVMSEETYADTIRVTPQRVSRMSVAYKTGAQGVTIYTSQAYTNGLVDLTKLKGLLNSSITVKDEYNTGLEESTNSYVFSRAEAGEDVATKGGTITLYVETVQFNEQYEIVSDTSLATYDADVHAAYDAAKAAAKIAVEITAVAPTGVTLAVKPNYKIYSSYTMEQVAGQLIVKETYNDGSERALSLSVWDETAEDFTDGYSINVTGGTIIGGGEVTMNVTYYDPSVRREFTSNTIENVEVTVLRLTEIRVESVDTNKNIYSSSTMEYIKTALTVKAYYNDNHSEVITDYVITPRASGGLPVSDSEQDAILDIVYTNNGIAKDTFTTVKVKPITPESITVSYNETGATKVELYTSDSLERVKEAISVRVNGTGNNDLGLLNGSAYSLSLEDIVEAGTDGASEVSVKGEANAVTVKAHEGTTLTSGRYVVVITYEYRGTAYKDRVMLEVEAYAIATSEVVLSSGVTLYSDYVFAEVKDTISAGLVMSATWNDGVNHSTEYKFEVVDVEEIVGDKEHVYATYNYVNKTTGIGETGVTKQITLTLITAEISDVKLEKAASYELYTSDDKTKITDASVSTLYLVYNSGREEATTWDGYTYTIDAPYWSNGGNVTVTLNIEVNGKQYTKGQTYYVQQVVLDRIEITSYESVGSEYIEQDGSKAIYATSNATWVLGAITLNAEAVKNDGARNVISIDASMLTYAFVDGASDGEVTLTYSEGGITKTAKFKVRLTKIALTGISAVLKNEEAKIYTNGTVSVLAGYLTVTATYNDGSSKEISYGGATGYTFTAGDIDIGSATVDTEKTVTLSYTEKGATAAEDKTETYEMTVKVSPATLVSIKATYNQGTAKLYASGGIAGILEASTLTVKATFETGTAGTTRQYESDINEGYVVKYYENGEEADLPDGGRIGITVKYTLGNTTVDTVFYVTITAKAQTGIRAEYELKDGAKIFNTTNTEERFIKKLKSIAIYKVYNDGDESEGAVISKDAAALEGETQIDGSLSVSINTSSNKWRVTFTYNGFTETKENDWYTGKIVSIEAEVDEESTYKAYIGTNATDIKNQLLKVTGTYDDEYVGTNGKEVLDAGQYRAAFVTGNNSQTVGKKRLSVTLNSGVTTYDVEAAQVDVYVYQKVEIGNVSVEYQRAAKAEDGTRDGEYSAWTEMTGELVGDNYYNVKATFIAADAERSVKRLTLNVKKGEVIYTASGTLEYAEGQIAFMNPAENATDTVVMTITGIYSGDLGDAEKDEAGNSLYEFYAGGLGVSTLSKNITVTRKAVKGYTMSYTPKADVTIYTTTTFDEIMNVLGTLSITAEYNDGDTEPVEGLEYVSSVGLFGQDGKDRTKQYTVLDQIDGKLKEGTYQLIIQYGGDGSVGYTNSLTVKAPQIVSYDVEWKEGVHVYYGDGIEQIVSGIKVTGAYNDYPASLNASNEIVYDETDPKSGKNVELSDISEIILTVGGAAFNGSYKPDTYEVSADVSKIENVKLSNSTVKTLEIEIEKKAIVENNIRFYTTYYYTGEKIEAIPTVVVNGTTLQPGADFVCSYPAAAGANVHVGETSGEVTVTGAGDYYAGSVTVNFKIQQAENAWTEALTISGWSYGNNESQPSAEAKFGEAEEIVYKYYTDSACKNEVTRADSVPSLGAGRYYVKATLSGNADYKDLESGAVMFTVDAAVMTAYANYDRGKVLNGSEVEYVYNGTSQSVSAVKNGFGVYNAGEAKLDDAVWQLSINESWDNVTWGLAGSEVSRLNAGTYTVQYNVKKANYGDVKGSFTLKIKQAEVTVTANAISVTYGDEIEPTGYSYELANSQGLNKLYGDDEFEVGTVTYGSSYEAGHGVGSADTIWVTGGLSNDNYNITYANNAVTVVARPVTITIKDKNSVYGDAELAQFTADVEGAYASGEEGAAVEYTLSGGAGLAVDANAGDYDIIIDVTANANYAITVANEHGGSALVASSGESSVKGVYTIAKKKVQINIVTGGESTYGEAIDIVASSTDSNGYSVKLKEGGNLFDISSDLPVATYTICVEMDSDNYESELEIKDKSGNDRGTADYVINKRPVAVSWADLGDNQSSTVIELVYTSKEILPKGSYTNIRGEEVEVKVTSNKTILGVGNDYSVDASTADANYILTNESKGVRVVKAKVMITVQDKTAKVGQTVGAGDGNDVKLTYTVSGVGENDTIEVVMATTYTSSSEAGEYDITATLTAIKHGSEDITDVNYEVEPIVNGKLYVSGGSSGGNEEVTISISNTSIAYFTYIEETKNSKGKVTGTKVKAYKDGTGYVTSASSVTEGEGKYYAADGNKLYISLNGPNKWSKISAIFGDAEVSAKTGSGATVSASTYVGTGTVITVNGVEITVILKGDVDGNGKLTAQDVSDLMGHVDKDITLSNSYLYAADIDENGKVTAMDVSELMSHIDKDFSIFTKEYNN